MTRPWDRIDCRDCAEAQLTDPFALCPECAAYYQAPLRWAEEHMQTEEAERA